MMNDLYDESFERNLFRKIKKLPATKWIYLCSQELLVPGRDPQPVLLRLYMLVAMKFSFFKFNMVLQN